MSATVVVKNTAVETAIEDKTTKFLPKPPNRNIVSKGIKSFYEDYCTKIQLLVSKLDNEKYFAHEKVAELCHATWLGKKNTFEKRVKTFMFKGIPYFVNVQREYADLHEYAKHENIQAAITDISVFFALKYAQISAEKKNDFAGSAIHINWMNRINMTEGNAHQFEKYDALSDEDKGYDYNRLIPIEQWFTEHPDVYASYVEALNPFFPKSKEISTSL